MGDGTKGYCNKINSLSEKSIYLVGYTAALPYTSMCSRDMQYYTDQNKAYCTLYYISSETRFFRNLLLKRNLIKSLKAKSVRICGRKGMRFWLENPFS